MGSHTVLPPGPLTAPFTGESHLRITPKDAPPTAINAAIVGPEATLSLDDLRHQRDATIAFHLAGYTLRRWFRDQEDSLKPWLLPSPLAITRRWMAEYLKTPGTLLLKLVNMAVRQRHGVSWR